jgi:hypothetical protein
VLLWSDHHREWRTLCGRVLEKASEYLTACLLHVLLEQDYTAYDRLCFWSDGPGQYKSRLVMSTICQKLLSPTRVTYIDFNYFAPKHGKGVCDAQFGLLSRLLEASYARKFHEQISDVISTLRSWGDQHSIEVQDSTPQSFEEFLPDKKEDYEFSKFTSASLRGIMGSFSWTFKLRDARRGTLFGRGANLTILTNVEVRSKGMAGLQAPCFGFPQLDLGTAGPEPEDDPEDLMNMLGTMGMTTQVYKGWRCSFAAELGAETDRLTKHLMRLADFLPRAPRCHDAKRSASPSAMRDSAVRSAKMHRLLFKQRADYRKTMASIVGA